MLCLHWIQHSVKTQHLKPCSDRQMNTLWRSAVGRRISQTKLPSSPCSSTLTRHVFIYQFSGIAPLAAQPPATSHKEPAGGQEDRTNGHRVGGRGRGQDKDFTCLTRTQVNTASQHGLRLYAKCNANTGKRRCLCVCVIVISMHAQTCLCFHRKGFSLPCHYVAMTTLTGCSEDGCKCSYEFRCVIAPFFSLLSPIVSLLPEYFPPSLYVFLVSDRTQKTHTHTVDSPKSH